MKWTTGMFMVPSSVRREVAKAVRPARVVDSGVWKAGLREVRRVGVRRRIFAGGGGGGVVDVGVGFGFGEVVMTVAVERMRGRKAWVVRIVERSFVESVSDQVVPGMISRGPVGKCKSGIRRRPAKVRWEVGFSGPEKMEERRVSWAWTSKGCCVWSVMGERLVIVIFF